MKVKNLDKTRTLICANLYDSYFYRETYTASRFIDASLKLAREFPDTFEILEQSFVHVIIKTNDLKHCFALYKHNEEKVIDKTSFRKKSLIHQGIEVKNK